MTGMRHVRPVYAEMKPEGHTRVCWASILGTASRDLPPQPAEVTATAAIKLYETNPELCVCPKYSHCGGTERAEIRVTTLSPSAVQLMHSTSFS